MSAAADGGLPGTDMAEAGITDTGVQRPDPDAGAMDDHEGDASADPSCGPGFRLSAQTCVDIDECEEGSSGCSPNAACNNTPGSRTCTCGPAFADIHGDGTECADKCSLADCDSNAVCTISEGEARCSCPSPYVGDGKTCAFDSNCSQLNCHADAECVVEGTTRSCKCREGFTGSGTNCTNVDECTATPNICGANATCSDTQGSYECTCKSGYRDEGEGCENIDDCAPNPCQNDGTCTDQVNAYTCACASGFTGPRCEYRICGNTTINTQASYEASLECAEIRGNLLFSPANLTSSRAYVFPNLTRVTGEVELGQFGGAQRTVASLRFPLLTSIGARLQIMYATATEVHFPELATIGAEESDEAQPAFQIISSEGLNVLTLPKLTRIEGDAEILTSKLCTLDMRRVTHAGAVRIAEVRHLPASAWDALRAAAQTTGSIGALGCCCCYFQDAYGCDSVDPNNPNQCPAGVCQ